MALKFSPDLPHTIINPCKSKRCKACGLYLNQPPITDKIKKSSVFWVGLSAVKFDEHEQKEPLAAHTPTGGLIHKIEEPFKDETTFYKTNLVKCVPLSGNKIRYPLEHEMEKCYPNFEAEIDELMPSLVFLLGKQVSSFVLKKYAIRNITLAEDFSYDFHEIGNIKYIPVHHPSFVLIYKRKFIDDYINSIQALFLAFLLQTCKSA